MTCNVVCKTDEVVETVEEEQEAVAVRSLRYSRDLSACIQCAA